MSHLRFEWTVPLNAHLNSVFSPWDFWPVDKQWCSFLLLFTSSDKVSEKTKQKNKNNKSSCALPQVYSFPFIYQLLLLYSDTQFQTVPSSLAHPVTKRKREGDSFSAIVSGLCQSETVFEFVAGFHALRNSVVCVCYSFITSWCSRGRAPCSTRPWRLWSVQTKV